MGKKYGRRYIGHQEKENKMKVRRNNKKKIRKAFDLKKKKGKDEDSR